jgi:signal transduction histidine kinase
VLVTLVWITWKGASRVLPAVTAAFGLAMLVGLALWQRTAYQSGVVYFVGGIGIAWISGSMLRRQDLLVDGLRQAQLRESQQSAMAERTRIAREIHDVVAHSLTVVLLHVGGARRTLMSQSKTGNDPTGTTNAVDALERAELAGRESLDSIRQIVGLLRYSDGSEVASEQVTPLPEIGDVARLVDQFRVAGLRVDADLQLSGVHIEPATSLTAFRVVQEALSNVLLHSPGAPCALVIAHNGDASMLEIVASNPIDQRVPPSHRRGLGLIGMSERVRSLGGSLEVGCTSPTLWSVRASLPLRALNTT